MNDEHWLRRLLFVLHRSSFIVLIAACATAPPPPPAPKWTEVPRGVLDAFCAKLHDEGISVETAMEVVTTTQPLITPQAMSGLAESVMYAKNFDAYTVAEDASRDIEPLAVVVPAGSCGWRAIDQKARRASDVMTVELSAPFKNPFARKASGLFARLSLARDSATWYWLPLAEREGRWVVGRPVLLGMR
jgi:hypothetical protein